MYDYTKKDVNIVVNIDKIKTLAKEQGLSLSFICTQLGVAKVYFNDIVKNNRDIPIEKLQIIADILNTTPEYLRDEITPLKTEGGLSFEIIKNLCEDHKMSLSSLALQLGFSRNIFGELKAGRIKSLSADKLSKIADYFDVSVDYLLGKTDNPEKAKNSRILDRIDKELKEQNKTQKMLCEHIGIKQQAYTNWKGGFSKSYNKYLPEIAEYLGVSVDYLLGKSDIPEDDITFDDFSFALYNETKELTEGQKKELLNMARYMKAAIEKEEREEKEGKNNV